jgi:hypothetical protein
MSDATMKKMKTISVSPLLSIDSPMVVQVLEGIDEPVPTGSTGEGGPTEPVPPVERFVAGCDQFHAAQPDLDIPAGRWSTGKLDRFAEAEAAASEHNNADATFGHGAYVMLSVGGALIGPVQQH